MFVDVVEEEDDGEWEGRPTCPPSLGEGGRPSPTGTTEAPSRSFEPLLQLVTRVATSADEEEAQREAAEVLHSLGPQRRSNVSALDLGMRSRERCCAIHGGTRHAAARCRFLANRRRSRPLRPGCAAFAARRAHCGDQVGGGILRWRHRRHHRRDWRRSVARRGAGSAAPIAAGRCARVHRRLRGAVGGAGVGAGLSVSEAAFRSQRTIALVAGAAAGGGWSAAWSEWISRWSLEALVGLHVDVGGGVEGVVIGAAAGLGYAVTTSGGNGGLAAPRGGRRLRVALADRCGLRPGGSSFGGFRSAAGRRHDSRHRARLTWVSSRAHTLQPLDRGARFRSRLPSPDRNRGGRAVRARVGARADAPAVNNRPTLYARPHTNLT